MGEGGIFPPKYWTRKTEEVKDVLWQSEHACIPFSRFSIWGPSADKTEVESCTGGCEGGGTSSSITSTKLLGNNPILSPIRPLHQPSSSSHSTSTVCRAYNHRHHSHSSQVKPHTCITTHTYHNLTSHITTYTHHNVHITGVLPPQNFKEYGICSA